MFRRVAIVGTGAIGGYYGALLARSGADVHFLARSDFETIRDRGLRITTPDEEFRCSARAYRTPDDIGECDLVIVALKATANGALKTLIPPLLGSRTALLTLENGLGSDELLAQLFGAERVIGGLCFICVNRTGPGEILCISKGSLALAEFGRPASERVRRLQDLFIAAGVKCAVSDNLDEIRWRKLVWNVPFNGLSIAAGGITTDKILADAGLEQQVRGLMLEVIHAASVFGHAIPASFIDHQIELTRPMGPYRPSSLIDYLAGREVEVEAIWGEPLRRAKARGAAVPKLELLHALISHLCRARNGTQAS
jgi:2-dehydropantoate 2-reductase